MLFLIFFVLHSYSSLKPLVREPRAVDVGSVLIENDTDEMIKVHLESNLVLSTFQATEVNGDQRTSSHGTAFSRGFTTVRPRAKKLVKFTIPSIDGNSLVTCSIFTTEMVKIVESETLENSNAYKLERIGDDFILEPLGNTSL